MTPPAAVRARVVPPLAIHQDGASVRIDVMHYDTARARASSTDGHSAKVRLYIRIESKTYTVQCRRGRGLHPTHPVFGTQGPEATRSPAVRVW